MIPPLLLRKTVTVMLLGRLGNQLYQYAAGIALARRHRARLLLNTYFLKRNSIACHLPSFKVEAEFVSCKPGFRSRFIERLLHRAGIEKRLYENDALSSFEAFRTDILNPRHRHLHLHGYWQDTAYFSDFSDMVRMHLELKSPPRMHELVNAAANQCSVAVHVRRGDYLAAPEFPLLPLSYYQSAADLIAKRCSNAPRFHVFSDDPEWVQRNFRLDHDWQLASHPGSSELDDFAAMRSCTHHIIANSTFSRWSSWLGSAPDKIVVAPNMSLSFDPAICAGSQPKTRRIIF